MLDALDGTELAEALDDGLLVVSRDGEVQAANAAAARLLRQPRDALIGARLADLLFAPPIVAACAERAEMRAVARDAHGFSLAVRVVPRAESAWVFVRATDLRPEPQRASEYLRTVLHHAPLVLFAFDAHGIITMSEGRSRDQLGAASRVGKSVFEVYADVPWIVDSARRALTGEAVSILGKLHDDLMLEVHYGPITGPDGRVSDVIGVAIDVSERERAYKQLSAQQSVLKYVLAHVPQAIFWKDRAGRFLGCNQHFLNHTGLATEAALIGMNDRELWGDTEEAQFFERIDQQVMTTGVPMLNIEESLLRPDGQQRFLLTSKVPLRDERGEVDGVLGIYVDITERKHIEFELQKAKEAADAALRAKGEFLTMMSHELRTPLTLVLGPLASLLADPQNGLGERVRASLTRIWRNAARLGHLVDDILDYQQLEAGKIQLCVQPVDVRESVESIVLDAGPAAEAAGIALHLDIAPDVGTVALDRRMFEKILLNLLGNALKFTPRGGAVTVALARSPRGITLAVSDTGPGIAPAEHELVFQRFQQLDSSTTRSHEGSGLGLALVREFAYKMDGTVSLRSELGAGACFTVELPDAPDRVPAREGPLASPRPQLAPVDARAPEPPAEPPPAPDRHLPRLIVVEDNPDMRAYIEEILGDEYTITLASTGVEALRAALDAPPDVILSDIMMPEMDGYALVSHLKSSPQLRAVPVILLSARASRGETARGLDLGADDYLAKPFAPEELRARVRAAVRLHRSHREVVDALRSLREAQEQLVQSSKMAAVGTLVAGLSHELNNPVAIIRMSAQMLLRRGSRDPFIRRTLERIERHSQRCASLVEALLAYTRRRPQVAERCDLAQTLRWVIDLAAPEARERGIEVISEFTAELPALIANRPALESALLNVLSNAVDATRPGGTVTVAARPRASEHDQPGVEIEVRDTGAGIAAPNLPHVFEPFFTTKAPGKGTGLGLSMTQKFVQAQGGTIHLDSEVDRGTTVRLWLPLVVKEDA